MRLFAAESVRAQGWTVRRSDVALLRPALKFYGGVPRGPAETVEREAAAGPRGRSVQTRRPMV